MKIDTYNPLLKGFIRLSSIAGIAILMVFMFSSLTTAQTVAERPTASPSAAGPDPVDLGTAGQFAILAHSAITNVPFSAILGNVGLSPSAGSFIGLTEGEVTGIIYTVDVSGPAGSVQNATLLTEAKGDLTAAYNDAAGRTLNPIGVAGNLGGQTLSPGLYKSTGTLEITAGDLTLDAGGDPDAVWIFQIASSFNMSTGRKVVLANGAEAGNIFWQVGSGATLGTDVVMKGTIMAQTQVTMATGSTLDGRAMALSENVTLQQNTINLPELIHTGETTGNTEGWRMLASPVQNTAITDLLSTVWTQGFPGSDMPIGTPNVLKYNEATRAWDVPIESEAIVSGNGLIAFIYADDNNDGEPNDWPKTFQVKGIPASGLINVDFSNTTPGDDFNGWHIAGNPYPFTLSWPALISDNGLSNIFDTMFVWDPNANEGAGSYRSNPGFPIDGAMVHDGNIAAFQGFWISVRGDVDPGQITFDPNYESSEGGTLFSQPETPDHLVISADGNGLGGSAILRFENEDELQIALPQSIVQPAMSFGFSGNTLLAQRNLDMMPGEVRNIPVTFGAIYSGTYTMSVTGHENWEQELDIKLVDHTTGQQVTLSREQGYSFSYQATATSNRTAKETLHLPDSEIMNIGEENRFELIITMGQPTSLPGVDLPQAFTLGQNYPNPFNPTTQIQYALPEAANVKLEVFNITGQLVATLVNGQQAAGQHTATFNAANMASGVYLYRIQAGSFTQTLKMSVIK